MPVTLAVLIVASIAALSVWWLSRTAGVADPIDPEAEERWLLRWLGNHPRWGNLARSIDRRVAGGLMLVLALTVVLGAALTVGLLFDMVDRNAGIARWDRFVADWEVATRRTGRPSSWMRSPISAGRPTSQRSPS